MNEYHFVTTWRVQGTTGEVADVLRNPLDLARWWPAVYLAVKELEPPDEQGLNQRVRLHTKGWLPYTLRWDLRVTSSRYPEHFAIEATGDFVGRGVWTFTQDGGFVNATYDWRIRAEKPLLKVLEPLMRPLLEANHRWAMKQGEESLKLELLRRRATTPEGCRDVPPPPGPIDYAAVGIVAGAGVLAAGLGYLVLRGRRRRARRARSER
jgi:Polyketide cyclase / dehydrase and lipid transport